MFLLVSYLLYKDESKVLQYFGSTYYIRHIYIMWLKQFKLEVGINCGW